MLKKITKSFLRRLLKIQSEKNLLFKDPDIFGVYEINIHKSNFVKGLILSNGTDIEYFLLLLLQNTKNQINKVTKLVSFNEKKENKKIVVLNNQIIRTFNELKQKELNDIYSDLTKVKNSDEYTIVDLDTEKKKESYSVITEYVKEKELMFNFDDKKGELKLGTKIEKVDDEEKLIGIVIEPERRNVYLNEMKKLILNYDISNEDITQKIYNFVYFQNEFTIKKVIVLKNGKLKNIEALTSMYINNTFSVYGHETYSKEKPTKYVFKLDKKSVIYKLLNDLNKLKKNNKRNKL